MRGIIHDVRLCVAFSLMAALAGCSDTEPTAAPEATAESTVEVPAEPAAAAPASTEEAPAQQTTPRFGGMQLKMPLDQIVADPAANAQRNAYYGDLHVHTTYSFDAFAFGTLATPYDAYRYAQAKRSSTRPASTFS